MSADNRYTTNAAATTAAEEDSETTGICALFVR